jgi:hypothetical protein
VDNSSCSSVPQAKLPMNTFRESIGRMPELMHLACDLACLETTRSSAICHYTKTVSTITPRHPRSSTSPLVLSSTSGNCIVRTPAHQLHRHSRAPISLHIVTSIYM